MTPSPFGNRAFFVPQDPGQNPFTYNAGVAQVITGWDQGIYASGELSGSRTSRDDCCAGCLGMALGEVRKLDIPADEGYGANGGRCSVQLRFRHKRCEAKMRCRCVRLACACGHKTQARIFGTSLSHVGTNAVITELDELYRFSCMGNPSERGAGVRDRGAQHRAQVRISGAESYFLMERSTPGQAARCIRSGDNR